MEKTKWVITFPTPPPPRTVEDLPFLLTLQEFHKIAFTPEDFKTSVKFRSTPEECKFTPEELLENVIFPCSPLNKILFKIKASSPKNSIFFYSSPKEILNLYKLTLKNSIRLQPGGGAGESCGY